MLSLLLLTIEIVKTIPNCSKAPRGLFVQVELGRVFTAIAISPSECSRQLLARDAIRAGRNLPDKELRYRRTVYDVTCYDFIIYVDSQSLVRSDYIFVKLTKFNS